MACNMGNGEVLEQCRTQTFQCFVLAGFKAIALQAFQLYANGKIIAIAAPQMAGGAGVPGTVIATDKLLKLALAANIKMRGDLHALNTFEVGVGIPVQLVGK
jgi:hypothetical protein